MRLDPTVLVLEDGCLLVGGSPSRLMRLRPAGARLVAGWRDGGAIGADRGAQALGRRLLDTGMLLPDPEPAVISNLAVVIPAHGRERSLARCLEALQRTAPGTPLFVIDDGSPDPTAIARVAEAHGAEVDRHPAARGPAAARNTGLALSVAPIVAFVDSDVVVHDGCLARLASHFADPVTGAVAPRVLSESSASGRLAAYEARHSSLDRGTRASRVRPGSSVPYVPAATLLVRREALAAGFDEQLPVGEDVDLVWRLGDAGWGVWYDPAATVDHELRPSAVALTRRRFTYATSIGALATLHPEALPAMRADPSALAIVLALLPCPRLATMVVAAQALRLHARLRDLTNHPMRPAIMLSGRSLLGAVRGLAHAVRRPWWPLCAALAVRNCRARRLLCAAYAVGLVESRPTRPSHAGLAVADDLIAGAGTWWSCVQFRTTVPLRPRRK